MLNKFWILSFLLFIGCIGRGVKNIDDLAKWSKCKPELMGYWMEQNIWYERDVYMSDEWKSAQRTIDERKGDCEDFAMIASEVLSVCGFQPVIMRNGRHVITAFSGGYFSNGILRSE